MKRAILRRGMRRLIPLTALVAGALFTSGSLSGAMVPAPPEDKPISDSAIVLTVLPMRDAGGLTEKGADGRPLNIRLTEAVRRYLTGAAGGRFQVRERSDQDPATRGKAAPLRLALSGDLSHVETDTPDGGPYMCVMRLSREGKSGTVLAQWAASADSLRCLTGNLQHDTRVDPEGLVGELGHRIVGAVLAAQRDQYTALDRLVVEGSQLNRVDTLVIPEPAMSNNPKEPAPDELITGTHYRLRVTAQEQGSVFLIGLSSEGNVQMLYPPEAEREMQVAPGRPTLLPPQEPLSAENATTPINRQIIVLVRCTRSSPKLRPLPAWSRGALDPAAPVRILDMALGNLKSFDPEIAKLLAFAAADPPGTWLAQRVTIHIVPRSSSGAK